MSSQPVRDALRSAWAVPGVPLFDTINKSADFGTADPPIWATFAFAADQNAHVSMGSKPWMEETGVAAVFLSSESGDADTAAVEAAQKVIEFWRMWVSPDGSTWISSIVGPRPPDPDAQGVTYSLIVDLVYTHQYRGA